MVEQLGGMSFDPPLGGTGYERLASPNRKPFKTKDGYISIIPYTAVHWVRFLKLVGRDDLVEDPRVLNSADRSRNIDMLYGVIEAAALSRTTDEWLSLLRERDVPCARVNRIDDLFDNEHLKAVQMFNQIDHPSEGPLMTVRTPFRETGAKAAPDRPAPVLGGDGRKILLAAGFSEEEIDQLLSAGAVGATA